MKKRRRGFTLIELLVVLTVLMIVSAMALPRLQEVRLRAMVTQAQVHVRQTSQGLELFAADHRLYPTSSPTFPEDPLALFSHSQLRGLTTPVAYVNSEALGDPFGLVRPQSPNLNSNDFPELEAPNTRRSLLYFDYLTLSERRQNPAIRRQGAAVVSIGPDAQDSLGVYRPFSPSFFAATFPGTGIQHPYDTVYSPTNGSRSGGDIAAFAGEPTRFAVP